MVEPVLKIKKPKILGSQYEEEICDLRAKGAELQNIADFMWKERTFSVSVPTLSRYFLNKKRLGKIATDDVRTSLKTIFKEEYMDLAGRIAFLNEVILEAKKRFAKEKATLSLSELLVLAGRFSDSLAKIEGADAQTDMIRDLLLILQEVKTTPIQHSLPIIEVLPTGEVKEVGRADRLPVFS